jgi:hypothetical protein
MATDVRISAARLLQDSGPELAFYSDFRHDESLRLGWTSYDGKLLGSWYGSYTTTSDRRLKYKIKSLVDEL